MSAARVAVVATGDPASPATWSGSGAGLVAGLRRRGVEVVTVDASPPSGVLAAALAVSAAVRRSRVDAGYTRGLDLLRSVVAARRLRAAGPVGGAIVLGAEQRLPRGMRYVVSADMTLLQARATHPVFSRLSEGTANAFAERQRHVYDHAVALAPWSHWAARSLVEDYGADPARVHVVGAGRNHEVQPRPRPWSPPRFLFVGREWERKGGPVVLEAFAAVQRALPDARLDVVGGHPPLGRAGTLLRRAASSRPIWRARCSWSAAARRARPCSRATRTPVPGGSAAARLRRGALVGRGGRPAAAAHVKRAACARPAARSSRPRPRAAAASPRRRRRVARIEQLGQARAHLPQDGEVRAGRPARRAPSPPAPAARNPPSASRSRARPRPRRGPPARLATAPSSRTSAATPSRAAWAASSPRSVPWPANASSGRPPGSRRASPSTRAARFLCGRSVATLSSTRRRPPPPRAHGGGVARAGRRLDAVRHHLDPLRGDAQLAHDVVA